MTLAVASIRNRIAPIPPQRLAVEDRLRPSEYTAALIHVLQREAHRLPLAEALEIGVGSGVVLAVLGRIGACRLHGVDIEREAVLRAARLLTELGLADRAELFQGDMWEPLADRRFDLIVANLPHFPAEAADFKSRYPSWSRGGRDGRELLDRFLLGLPRRLAAGGRAIITHNAFVDLEGSRELLQEGGLDLRVLYTTTVFIPPEKLCAMTPEILARWGHHAIHRCGLYAFADMHIVEIGFAGDVAPSQG